MGLSLERFVRWVAPTTKIDFFLKLCLFVLICGALNQVRDILLNGMEGRNSLFQNLRDAAFIAFPMTALALKLIAHLNTLQSQLFTQANRDVLTGLHNRRWFMDNVPPELPKGSALFLVDLDHFKRINDTYGHDVGDLCLRQTALHLNAVLRPIDACARMGGEEFAVYMPDTRDISIALVATHLSDGFTFDTGKGQRHRVTASVGVCISDRARSRTEALRLADQAAYQAKNAGRARFVTTTDAVAPTGIAAA